MTPVQLPLILPQREAFGHEDFLVASCNQEAVTWIDRWPDWPSHVLILYGPPGSGKTHLSHVWQKKSGARRLTHEDVAAFAALDRDRPCILEDVELFLQSGPGRQEQLLHLYNWLREQNNSLLLTAYRPPRHWPMTLADLSSRILSCVTAEISAPDDRLLSALIIKQFSDRQLAVSAEVLEYILPRMPRSFDAARQLVEKTDLLALSEKRRITIPLVRKALEGLRDC
tara:strand:+ start:3835 stop:4515 length:681 start_codon:yes stop_codon:yes gene_type:complete